VVTLDSVTEACPLLVGTSAQNAKLITLTWALQLTAGLWVNIYTILTLNMPSQLFTSMGPYIRIGAPLTLEKKVSSMGRKSSNC
jgi:hypothetical protein